MSHSARRGSAARALLAAGLFGLAFVVLLGTAWGRASAAPTPSAAQYQYTTFLGDWVSSEPDGSVLTLKVAGAGSSVNVTVTDSIINGFCNGDSGTARGTGTIEGTTLSALLTLRCKGTKGSFPVDAVFQDSGDGTLSGLGVTWTRP
jgi:hypothetical protein